MNKNHYKILGILILIIMSLLIYTIEIEASTHDAQSTHADILRRGAEAIKDTENDYLYETHRFRPAELRTLRLCNIIESDPENIMKKDSIRKFIKNNIEDPDLGRSIRFCMRRPDIAINFFKFEYGTNFYLNEELETFPFRRYNQEQKTFEASTKTKIELKDYQTPIGFNTYGSIINFLGFENVFVKTKQNKVNIELKNNIHIEDFNDIKKHFDEVCVTLNERSIRVQNTIYEGKTRGTSICFSDIKNEEYVIRTQGTIDRTAYLKTENGEFIPATIRLRHATLKETLGEGLQFTILKNSQIIDSIFLGNHRDLTFREDSDFYIFTNTENVKNIDSKNPCFEKETNNPCFAWNLFTKKFLDKTETKNYVVVSNTPSNQLPFENFDAAKIGDNLRIDNTRTEYINYEKFPLNKKDFLGPRKNNLEDDLKERIISSFLSANHENNILGTYFVQIFEMRLRQIINNFQYTEPINKQFFEELAKEINTEFPQLSFSFEIEEDIIFERDDLLLDEDIDPTQGTLNDFVNEYLDSDNEYENIIRVLDQRRVESGQALSYIDNEGRLYNNRLREYSEEGHIDVDAYIGFLMDVELHAEKNLSDYFNALGDSASSVLTSTINNFINEYNERNNENFEEITRRESQILINAITGKANINKDVLIRDIQEIIMKIPFFREGMGPMQADNKLGPLTSKTFVAFSASLSRIIDINTAKGISHFYFENNLFENDFHFISDVSGSVSRAHYTVVERLLKPLILDIERGDESKVHSLTKYVGHFDNAVGDPIFEVEKINQFLKKGGVSDTVSGRQLECPIFAANNVMNKLIEQGIELNESFIFVTLDVDGSPSERSFLETQTINERDYIGLNSLKQKAKQLEVGGLYFIITSGDTGFWRRNNLIPDAYYYNVLEEEITLNGNQIHLDDWGEFIKQGKSSEEFFRYVFFDFQEDGYEQHYKKIRDDLLANANI